MDFDKKLQELKDIAERHGYDGYKLYSNIEIGYSYAYEEAYHYADSIKDDANNLKKLIKELKKLDDRPQGEDEDGTL